MTTLSRDQALRQLPVLLRSAISDGCDRARLGGDYSAADMSDQRLGWAVHTIPGGTVLRVYARDKSALLPLVEITHSGAAYRVRPCRGRDYFEISHH